MYIHEHMHSEGGQRVGLKEKKTIKEMVILSKHGEHDGCRVH